MTNTSESNGENNKPVAIKPSKLTYKQESFCQAVALEGLNHTQAYIKAYDTENMLPATINNKAYELTLNGDVTARINELKHNELDSFIMPIKARYQRLEQIALEDIHNERGTPLRTHNIQAIDLINKMSHTYEDKPLVDNRQINIYVQDKDVIPLLDKVSDRKKHG